jgi:hypothetical protein
MKMSFCRKSPPDTCRLKLWACLGTALGTAGAKKNVTVLSGNGAPADSVVRHATDRYITANFTHEVKTLASFLCNSLINLNVIHCS